MFLSILNYLKTLASLVGAVATTLLGVYQDNETLVIIAAVSTAILTWAVPNIDVAALSEFDDEVDYDTTGEDDIEEVDPDSVDISDHDLPIEAAHGAPAETAPRWDAGLDRPSTSHGDNS
jgi:hypothetical protein